MAEGADNPIPEVPIPPIAPRHRGDTLAQIEAAQQRQEAMQRQHDIMLDIFTHSLISNNSVSCP